MSTLKKPSALSLQWMLEQGQERNGTRGITNILGESLFFNVKFVRVTLLVLSVLPCNALLGQLQ